MDSMRDALLKSEVFQSLTDDEIATVQPLCEAIKVPEGALIVEEDAKAGRCFLLLKGRVDIEIRPPFDNRPAQKIATIKGGQMFGEISLIDGFLRSASGRAAEACELIAIDGDGLRAVLEEQPRIGFKVMRNLSRVLAARIRDTNMKLRNTLSEILYY